jgi:hypothetical protein
MSLKAFHIVFIVLSVGTTAGFGIWALTSPDGSMALGLVSLVAAVLLVIYGVAFLNKMKREGL